MAKKSSPKRSSQKPKTRAKTAAPRVTPKLAQKPAPKAKKPTRLSTSARLIVSGTTLFRAENETDVSVVNLRDQCSYRFSGAGAYIWSLLDGTRDFEEIVHACKADLKIAKPGFDKSCFGFIQQLIEQNLAKVVVDSANQKPFASLNLDRAAIAKQPKLADLKTIKPAWRPLLSVAGTSPPYS